MNTPAIDPHDATLAAALSEGLRDLAGLIAAHPEIAPQFEYALMSMGILVHPRYPRHSEEPTIDARLFVSTALATGATVATKCTGRETTSIIAQWPTGIRASLIFHEYGVTNDAVNKAVDDAREAFTARPWWAARHPLNPWTPHGYHVTPLSISPVDMEHRPNARARCGGPGLCCRECRAHQVSYFDMGGGQ